MERDKIVEYLRSDCVDTKEIKRMLEQFKDKNDNFMIELLVHLKSDNLDQVERTLDDEHQLRTIITDILIEVSSRDQLFYQLCRYISIWNTFNKILEIEDEKKRINREIQIIITRAPIARKILNYLYDNPRANCAGVSKGVRYNQENVASILDSFCDKDVVYKISIGDNSIYDLTDFGRIWVDKNVGNDKSNILYVKKNSYEDMLKWVENALQGYRGFTPIRNLADEDEEIVRNLLRAAFDNYVLRYDPKFSEKFTTYKLKKDAMLKVLQLLDTLTDYYIVTHMTKNAIREDFEKETGLNNDLCDFYAGLVEENYELLLMNYIAENFSEARRKESM